LVPPSSSAPYSALTGPAWLLPDGRPRSAPAALALLFLRRARWGLRRVQWGRAVGHTVSRCSVRRARRKDRSRRKKKHERNNNGVGREQDGSTDSKGRHLRRIYPPTPMDGSIPHVPKPDTLSRPQTKHTLSIFWQCTIDVAGYSNWRIRDNHDPVMEKIAGR